MAEQLNRRLSQQDAGFLYFERANAPMHGVGIAIYAGELSLNDVIEAIESRLHLMPRYRQIIVTPPYGIAHPTWEDDPNFDIRKHITEETVAPPGDDRALGDAAAKHFVPPLDRSIPLWKMVVVHGLAGGNTAIFSMAHHAMIDGVSGVDLMLVMHDLTPDAVQPVPQPWQPKPIPDQLTLLQDAVRDNLIEAAERWTEQTFQPFRPNEAAARAQQITNGLQASMPQMAQPAPRTRFNGPISNRRAASWAQFSFGEIRACRSVLGGTVNDVVLTIIAGGIGKYLRRHGDSTRGLELRAMCPVSMRAPEGHGALGNQVSMMLAPLFVGMEDPVERHNAERAAMERLKQQGQAAAFYAMSSQPVQTPPWQQALAGQVEVAQTMMNTVSSNMPGPQVPLYMKGHKLLQSFGTGMLSANIGVFHGILSYNQVLTIGVTVDPTQIPDQWVYAECLLESFAELRAAAEKAAAAKGAAGPIATSTAQIERTPRSASRETAAAARS